MPTYGNKQAESSVLEQLQPYTSQRVERLLEQLDLTEDCVTLQFCGFKFHRTRRVTHSRRRRWGRWVSLFAVLGSLMVGIIKFWLMS
jgi:hypothetical protein